MKPEVGLTRNQKHAHTHTHTTTLHHTRTHSPTRYDCTVRLHVEYAERRINYGIRFIFSPCCEYSHREYEHVPAEIALVIESELPRPFEG